MEHDSSWERNGDVSAEGCGFWNGLGVSNGAMLQEGLGSDIELCSVKGVGGAKQKTKSSSTVYQVKIATAGILWVLI